jgi:hypothetical protein
MNIIILCNQVDCTFNRRDLMYPKDTVNNCCIHPHPSVQKWGEYPEWSRCICNSKDRRVTDPFVISPSCATCETPDSDNCVNCCHNKSNKK